jgi:DNA-directed RNA polymerase specialized sigma24 family protein
MSVSNRAELIDGYVAGVPVRELATRFNVHRGTVREIARQAGLTARQNCLNALAGSVACRVTAWLIVGSSWSVRSSRLLART